MNRRTIFITGGTGFLGQHLVRTCVERGFDVRVLVRDRARAIRVLPGHVTLIEGDLFDEQALTRGCDGSSIVVHAAARLGGWGGVELFRRDNLEGTRTLLKAVSRSNVRHFAFISSAAVYGRQTGQPIHESSPFVQENDPYCATKIECERAVQEFSENWGGKTTVVRPGIIYGPGDTHFLPLVMRQLRGPFFVVFGRKGQGPPLVYVEDVVEIVLASVAGQTSRYETLNAVEPDGPSWERIIDEIRNVLPVSSAFMRVPYAVGFLAGLILETVYKASRAPHAPVLTRFTLSLIGLQYRFDSSKSLLLPEFRGFTPFAAGIRKSLGNTYV